MLHSRLCLGLRVDLPPGVKTKILYAYLLGDFEVHSASSPTNAVLWNFRFHPKEMIVN